MQTTSWALAQRNCISQRFGLRLSVLMQSVLPVQEAGYTWKCRERSSEWNIPPSELPHLYPSILQCHSAFLACSFNPGAVPSFVTFPFSISAAHSAAPTVFVNANNILATGTNSSKTAATPKLTHTCQHISRVPLLLSCTATTSWLTYLVYAALYSSICFCFCVPFHCFN